MALVPLGSFPFVICFLLGVLVLVRVTLVRQCCMNVEEFIKLICGGDSE